MSRLIDQEVTLFRCRCGAGPPDVRARVARLQDEKLHAYMYCRRCCNMEFIFTVATLAEPEVVIRPYVEIKDLLPDGRAAMEQSDELYAKHTPSTEELAYEGLQRNLATKAYTRPVSSTHCPCGHPYYEHAFTTGRCNVCPCIGGGGRTKKPT